MLAMLALRSVKKSFAMLCRVLCLPRPAKAMRPYVSCILIVKPPGIRTMSSQLAAELGAVAVPE
jgi:hypothetical protein